MALHYDLPVYKDVYALIRELFACTANFSQAYKYNLGQDIKRDGLNLVRSIYRANKHKDKLPHLEAFLDDFELLKLELRLCSDLKLISTRKHAELSVLLSSIGKQVTAWRNAQVV
jgi:hypothetical protein